MGSERFGTERAELYVHPLLINQNDVFTILCNRGASVMTTANQRPPAGLGICSNDFHGFFLSLDIQELIRVSRGRCNLMTKQIDVMIKIVEEKAIKSQLDNA